MSMGLDIVLEPGWEPLEHKPTAGRSPFRPDVPGAVL